MEDFHLSKINLLANRVANAMKSASNCRVEVGSTPNRIGTGIGSQGTDNIVDRVLNISVQKLSDGRVENIN